MSENRLSLDENLGFHLDPRQIVLWCLAAFFIIPDYFSSAGGWSLEWLAWFGWDSQAGWVFYFANYYWTPQSGWASFAMPSSWTMTSAFTWILPLVLVGVIILGYYKSITYTRAASIVSIILLVSFAYLDWYYLTFSQGTGIVPIEELLLVPIAIFSFISPSYSPKSVEPTRLTKFCRRCGTRIPRDTKFCKICGTKQVQLEYPTVKQNKALSPSGSNGLMRRLNSRTMLALGTILIVIVLIVVSMSTPWYSGSYHNGSQGWKELFYLDQSCNEQVGYYPLCMPLPISRDITNVAYPTYYGFADARDLMLGGLILAILTFTFIVLGMLWPKIGLAVGLCGILGSVVVLLAVLHFSMYISSTDIASHFDTIGYDAGWFTALVSGVLLVVSTITALYALKTVAPLGNIRLGAVTGIQAVAVTAQQPRTRRRMRSDTETGDTEKPAVQVQTVEEVQVEPKTTSKPDKTTMYCRQCGTVIPRDSIFCKECGSKLVRE